MTLIRWILLVRPFSLLVPSLPPFPSTSTRTNQEKQRKETTANTPAVAPATGTPETGGWSTRELRTIIRGLEGINLVAADIVEVAPAYDTNAEHTTMAAADALYEIMSLMVKKGPLSKMVTDAEELEREARVEI